MLTPLQFVAVHLNPALTSAAIGYNPPEVEVVSSARVLPASCLRG